MMKRVSIASGALALSLLATAAHADGFSIGNLFGANTGHVDRSQISAAVHNRYAPYASSEDQSAGKVYASGYYTSAARSQAMHSRYDN